MEAELWTHKINATFSKKNPTSFASQDEHQYLADIFYLAFLDLHHTSERSYENKWIVYEALR